MPLHVSSTCAHHQEVKLALHSLWCDDTRGCVMHEIKLTVEQICASSCLNIEIEILCSKFAFWKSPANSKLCYNNYNIIKNSFEGQHFHSEINYECTGITIKQHNNKISYYPTRNLSERFRFSKYALRRRKWTLLLMNNWDKYLEWKMYREYICLFLLLWLS